MPIEAPERQRLLRVVAYGVAAVAGCLMLLPLVGPTDLDLVRAFQRLQPDAEILFHLRLPRVVLGLVAGGGLAVAGSLFQALVRDALADPYVLGVAGGAAAGAVIAIACGWAELAGYPGISVAAFLGAGLALLLVLGIATQGDRISSFTLLLAGITVNSFCAALILFLHSIAEASRTFAAMRWLMGSLEVLDIQRLWWSSSIVLATVGYLWRHARQWNLLAVGSEWAEARGVPSRRLLITGFVAASLITGLLTSLTGPIAFVGLMVPHALRLRLGADHRVLIPACFFAGAVFLAVSDTLARTVLAPVEIPVGVVTAMMGAPYFIWLLRSRKRSLWL